MIYVKLKDVLSILDTVSSDEGIKRKCKAIRKRLKELPEEDVEKVVYCKDCKHLYCCSAVNRRFFCRHHLGLKGCLNPIEENPFCSYGKRKEGAEE